MKSNQPFTSSSGISHAKEDLSPYFVQAVQTAKAELPEAIGARPPHHPLSRGGLTIEENLQALCPKCNLVKGNR